MHQLLDTSSAATPTGISPQRRLFRINYGTYAGRLVCLYGKSSSYIDFSFADPPYSNWSNPLDLITDSADYPCSVCLDRDGNIYIIYVQQSTLNLIFFKLTFSAGGWNSSSPVTVLNASSAYFPVIVRAENGNLWCAFAYYDSGEEAYFIKIKSSTDGGLTWGSGPSDTGTALSESSNDLPYVCLNFIGNDLYAVYCQSRSYLYFRRRDYLSGDWDSAVNVLNSSYIDSQFDCAVSDDYKLGIVASPSSAGRVYFREYDGVNLSGLQDVVIDSARAPQIGYKRNVPFVFYARDAGNNCFFPEYAFKEGGSFATGNFLDGFGLFDKVLLTDSQTYEDKTEEASSIDPADVYHSSSSALVASIDDCLYLGKDSKFFSAAIILSTPGNGGTVIWEYFDGESWTSFTPYSGNYDFAESDKIVYLWADLDSVPSDWQRNIVFGANRFWVRVRVSGGFSTAPVGSQLMAATETDFLMLAREAK
jgi:hypothetical protein